MKCIFCEILKGNIPSAKVYEDDLMLVFKDIEPKAKIHYIAIPKNHFAYLDEMSENDSVILGKMLKTIAQNKEKLGLCDGYRLIINQGADAGQTVFHLHIHILGGQRLEFADLR